MISKHISCVVHASPEAVYAFASDPRRLPMWAAGLARSEVVAEGDTLTVDSPMGGIVLRFRARNDLGVLDHDVTLPLGTTVYNPMRGLAHPEGSEIVFTLRQLDLTDEEFERDARQISADLQSLRKLVEAELSI